MADHFAVTQIPGVETGEIPPSPVDRDEKTAIIYPLVDPLWDIDTLPLTYTNSRWSAFFYRADEKALRRVIPDFLDLEDDVVEYWYVDHNNTGLGPYGEFGVTVSASHRGGDGKVTYAGYYPYMYLTQDSAIDAGRVLGFPKKEAFIRVLEHGGAPDDGYGVLDGKNYHFDHFSFLLIRNGYVLHSATGKYDDADLSAKPKFYGNTDYGRFNVKVVTAPDLSRSEWQLVHLGSLVDKELATAIGRPDAEGSHRFQIKPESIRTAGPDSINWFSQATPYDNLNHELPVQELIGLTTFSFDLIIPAGEVLHTESYERDATWAGAAKPYRYGLRHRFPKPVGLGA
ncbi:MAG: acetoacetate decarboxylase family protein [Thermoleophilia bacterium]